MLRGLAAMIVAFGAHFLGIFWLNLPAACDLLGIQGCSPHAALPSGLAVLHVFTWFSYGHFGVALFFLISGFVIPFSLNRLSPAAFLVARFFRIYPTYWVALAVSLLVLELTRQKVLWDWSHLAYQAALLRDLAWLPSLDGISWTLEIEIKFYLLCALISPIIVRVRVAALAAVLLALGTASIVLTHSTVGAGIDVAHWAFGQPWYGIVHGMGMSLLFILYMLIGTLFNWHCRKGISGRALAWFVGSLFVWFVVVWANNKDYRPLHINGTLNYLLALLVFLVVYLCRDSIRVPRLLRWFGDISYPLYAIHPIVGYALLYWLVFGLKLPAWGAILVAGGGTLALAWLLHRFVEGPSNRLGKAVAKGLAFLWPARSRSGQVPPAVHARSEDVPS